MDDLNLSSQVETLLEDGDSNEKLKKMDSVEGYFESLVEKKELLSMQVRLKKSCLRD